VGRGEGGGSSQWRDREGRKREQKEEEVARKENNE